MRFQFPDQAVLCKVSHEVLFLCARPHKEHHFLSRQMAVLMHGAATWCSLDGLFVTPFYLLLLHRWTAI
jgi:hypothetical protein